MIASLLVELPQTLTVPMSFAKAKSLSMCEIVKRHTVLNQYQTINIFKINLTH